MNADTKEITVDARTAGRPKPVVVAATAETKFRRYAPDSVRFSDAKPSAFADLKVGDQVRALGTKSADGARFTPDEIVTGAFQTISGSITEIDAEKKEIKIKDLQSQAGGHDRCQQRFFDAAADSGNVDRAYAPKTGIRQTPPAKGSGDLQEMFDQLPAVTLSGAETRRFDSYFEHKRRGSRACHGDRSRQWGWTVASEHRRSCDRCFVWVR